MGSKLDASLSLSRSVRMNMDGTVYKVISAPYGVQSTVAGWELIGVGSGIAQW